MMFSTFICPSYEIMALKDYRDQCHCEPMIFLSANDIILMTTVPSVFYGFFRAAGHWTPNWDFLNVISHYSEQHKWFSLHCPVQLLEMSLWFKGSQRLPGCVDMCKWSAVMSYSKKHQSASFSESIRKVMQQPDPGSNHYRRGGPLNSTHTVKHQSAFIYSRFRKPF